MRSDTGRADLPGLLPYGRQRQGEKRLRYAGEC